MPEPKDSLFITSINAVKVPDKKDTLAWCEISKLINGYSLYDRSGIFKMPFRFAHSEHSFLPSDSKGFNKTYEQICTERVQEILQLQASTGRKIGLLYSGGIDSTMVAVSFLKVLKPKEFKEKVSVFLNRDSIAENPNFYYDHLRKISHFETSERLRSLFDGNHIIVDGEFNDQLFGSDLLLQFIRRDGEQVMHKKLTREFVLSVFQFAGFNPEYAAIWTELLLEHMRLQKVSDITTVSQFFWWVNFIFKWQAVYFRILLRILPQHRHMVNAPFLKDHFQHFFNSLDFQRWAIANPDLKIKNTWQSYKWHAKDVIYEFNKDANYRDHKVKMGSLKGLFQQNKHPIALTSSYLFLNEINGLDFYQPDNIFADLFNCRE